MLDLWNRGLRDRCVGKLMKDEKTRKTNERLMMLLAWHAKHDCEE